MVTAWRVAALLIALTSSRARAKELDRVEWGVPVVHSLGLLTTLRVSEAALWPKPFAQFDTWGGHYEEAFTKPPLFDPSAPFMRWDGDSLAVNVVGHGLLGSELYLRARQCHFGWFGSFAFAAGASAVWEFGFEANGTRPSLQDLIYTPLMGLAFGELRYAAWTAAGKLKRRGERRVLRAVFDPFGELERLAGTVC